MPVGMEAKDLPDATVAGGDGFLDLFGRPARETPCECERSGTVSLGQALDLINGPTINDTIHSKDGRIARLMQTHPTDSRLVEEVFLATLSRFATAKEQATALTYLKNAPDHTQGAQDLMWALINSPAFLFNR